MRLRVGLVVSGLVLLLFTTQGANADAAPSQGLTTATVKEAGIAIDYPASWSMLPYPKGRLNAEFLQDWFEQFPEAAALLGIDPSTDRDELDAQAKESLRRIRLFAVDVSDGDNVIVKIEPSQWYDGIDEWRAIGKLSAESTNGKVLSSGETRVGRHQAFTHLEQYEPEPGSGAEVIYGYMEIRRSKQSVVSISLTVDANDRATADAILTSVRAL